MSSIVGAGFDSLAAAESAAHALFADGIHQDAIDLFQFDDTTASDASGSVASGVWASLALFAAVGAASGVAVVSIAQGLPALYGLTGVAVALCVGALLGGLLLRDSALGVRRRPMAPIVLLAVQAESGQEEQIGQLLRDAGGTSARCAHSRWLERRRSAFPLEGAARRDDLRIH